MLKELLYTLVLASLVGTGGCLVTGCASEEKRDAFLPSTVRNIELTNLNLLEGQKALAEQHEMMAGAATAEELSLISQKIDGIQNGVEDQMKNGLDATIPTIMAGYDAGTETIIGWLQGLGVLGLGGGALAGRKTIGKVLTGSKTDA